MARFEPTVIDQDIATELSRFAYDPVGFVRFAFEWGVGELADYAGPDEWQVTLLTAVAEGLLSAQEAQKFAISSGHGIGKGAVTAWIILWAMSTRPHLSGVVTANTARQLETKTWRELALWHKRLLHRHWFEWSATKFVHRQHRDTWFVAAIPWSETNTEAFAGLHAAHVLVIFDEASAIPDTIWDVCEGAMTTPSALWCVFGNPTRNTGRFKECFGRFRHRWQARKVDSRSAKMANQKQIAQWVTDYGEDSDFVRVRVRGEFPQAATTQLIGQDKVQGAIERPLAVVAALSPETPLVMGVDVARFGSDQSVLAFRKGADARALPMIQLAQMDTMQVAARVAEACLSFQPAKIYVDGGGVGGGVIDRLRQLGYAPTEVNFGAKAQAAHRYTNRRAEMWDRLRQWLAIGCLPNSDQLMMDLTAPDYSYDAQNRLLLESKEDMKKRGLASPDLGDALALTFAEDSLGRVHASPPNEGPVVLDTGYHPLMANENIY